MRTTSTLMMTALLAACGGASKQAAKAPAAPTRLCKAIDQVDIGLSAMAGMGVYTSHDTEAILAALQRPDATLSMIDTGDHGQAFAWSSCSAPGCDAGIAFFERTGDGITVTHQATLPGATAASPGAPADITSAIVDDADEDGAPELWVYYSVPGPLDPGGGADVAQHAAIFSVPDLALAWHDRLAVDPGAGDRTCFASVAVVDLDCDDKADLVVEEQCGPADCWEGEHACEQKKRRAFVRRGAVYEAVVE